MVPAYSHKIPRVLWYSGYCPPILTFTYGALTLFGRSFQCLSVSSYGVLGSPYPRVLAPWFGLARFRSPLLPRSMFLSLPPFQFTGFPQYAYFIQHTVTESSSAGFPHSDICGSLLICSSPQLFAACHVFLRLLVPGHPSCALLCLTLC